MLGKSRPRESVAGQGLESVMARRTVQSEPAAPPTPADESVLSLIYRGALPEILRRIATEIESGNADAEHFSTRVTRDVFELSATINLTGTHSK